MLAYLTYYEADGVTLYHGDCVDVLADLPDQSVDAVVTDPPYELGFMGKRWDAAGIAYSVEMWRECLRVLKPGGHLVAFGGTRTYHRMTVAIEDAGFEVRDSLMWLYGSGFPKSHNIGKAIDKAAGAEREVVRPKMRPDGKPVLAARSGTETRGAGWDRPWRSNPDAVARNGMETAAATPEAAEWDGWGTALKPAFEPIVLARKPLVGTVAANVLAHGTGGLNVDGCRIGTGAVTVNTYSGRHAFGDSQVGNGYESRQSSGRWPANVALDPEAAAILDQQSGTNIKGQVGMTKKVGGHRFITGDTETVQKFDHGVTDIGGASRFFYTAKADSSERPAVDGVSHPTVKPLDLMQWLVRLVTPPGGVVLEPFAGSGTTVEACIVEGFSCIAIEREADYLPLILQRITKPIEVTLL